MIALTRKCLVPHASCILHTAPRALRERLAMHAASRSNVALYIAALCALILFIHLLRFSSRPNTTPTPVAPPRTDTTSSGTDGPNRQSFLALLSHPPAESTSQAHSVIKPTPSSCPICCRYRDAIQCASHSRALVLLLQMSMTLSDMLLQWAHSEGHDVNIVPSDLDSRFPRGFNKFVALNTILALSSAASRPWIIWIGSRS